jgi:PAS domain S-box-containing protein
MNPAGAAARVTARQLIFIVVAITAIASLRFLFGPFSLQGVLFVGVVAIAAWRVGPAAGLLAAVGGLLASHVLRVVANPSVVRDPTSVLTRQYVVGVSTYLVLCAIAILVGRRHHNTVLQLAATRAAKHEAELENQRQLQAALDRERAARVEAERLNRVREQLVAELSRELQRARDLAAIVEWSDDAIVAADLSNTVRSWNRAAAALFGYSASEMLGRTLDVIIPEEHREEDRKVVERVARGETVLHFEAVRRRRDGSRVDVALTVSPIRDADGNVIGASRIGRDISERRAAEQSIRELQTRLVALAAASSTLLRSPRVDDVTQAVLAIARDLLPADAYAVWRSGADGRWRVEASAGLSPGFVAGAVEEQAGIAPEGPMALEEVERVPWLGERRQAYRAEGIRSLLLVPLLSEQRATGAAVFYYRAVHHFSDAELQAGQAFGNLASAALTTAALYDQQRRSRSESEFLADAGVLLANSLDYTTTLTQVARLVVPFFADVCAVDLVDETGAIGRLTIAFEPDNAGLADALGGGHPSDARSAHSVRSAIKTGSPVLVTDRDTASTEAAAYGGPVGVSLGDLGVRSIIVAPMVARERGVGALTFAAGATGRPYSHDDLRFAGALASRVALAVDNARAYDEATRANRLKDEFLATLSHELRTPLNAVLGYARMVNTGAVAGDRVNRAITIIERNAQSLGRLVDDVLDVSRFATGSVLLKRQPIDLRTVVQQAAAAIQPAAEAKAIRLTVRIADGPIPVLGDPDRLQQVAWNVLGNAVKFTGGGGRIELDVTMDTSEASVTVRDSGSGIAADFLPHVFDRFRQGDARFVREHGGLGLGLAIARDIVHLHGGTIQAASPGPGQGATFRFSIPLRAAREAEEGTAEAAGFDAGQPAAS